MQALTGQRNGQSALINGLERLGASIKGPKFVRPARARREQRRSDRKACGVSCTGLQHVCQASDCLCSNICFADV